MSLVLLYGDLVVTWLPRLYLDTIWECPYLSAARYSRADALRVLKVYGKDENCLVQIRMFCCI